jgi:hypothetical protein
MTLANHKGMHALSVGLQVAREFQHCIEISAVHNKLQAFVLFETDCGRPDPNILHRPLASFEWFPSLVRVPGLVGG